MATVVWSTVITTGSLQKSQASCFYEQRGVRYRSNLSKSCESGCTFHLKMIYKTFTRFDLLTPGTRIHKTDCKPYKTFHVYLDTNKLIFAIVSPVPGRCRVLYHAQADLSPMATYPAVRKDIPSKIPKNDFRQLRDELAEMRGLCGRFKVNFRIAGFSATCRRRPWLRSWMRTMSELLQRQESQSTTSLLTRRFSSTATMQTWDFLALPDFPVPWIGSLLR
jgi:hypothetical protein